MAFQKGKRIAALIMAMVLIFGMSMQTAADNTAQVDSIQETVYGVIHEAGETSVYSVYKMRVVSPGEFTIYGDFAEGRCLTEDIEFLLHEQGVTLIFPKAYESFYFQVRNNVGLPGTHSDNVVLPFIVRENIELDGHSIIATGGESGHVRIVVEVQSNEKADEFFRKNFVAQVQIPVDTNVFKNIKTDLSGVLIGSTYTFSGMVLPGQSSTFTVEGDVESLKLDSINITMMQYNMSAMVEELGIAEGISGMEEGAGELADGTRQLADGIEELSEGLKEVSEGANTLKDSAKEFSEGMDKYGAGLGELSAGGSVLAQSLMEYAEGIKQLDAQGAALIEGFVQLQYGLGSLAGGGQTDALAEGLQSIAAAIENSPTMSMQEKQQILAVISGMVSSITQQDYTEIFSQIETYGQGLRQYVEGVTALSAGASALSEGTSKYVKGVDALKDNFVRLSAGAKGLFGGMASLSDGLGTISAKVSEMPEQVSKLADGQHELYDGIKSFSAALSDFAGDDEGEKIVSINSPRNDVDQVQIVMRTSAIEQEKPVKEKPQSSMTQTIFEKILNLFRKAG
jgi:putative membrane protein